MAKVSEVIFRIKGDAKQFNSELASTEQNTKGFASKIGSAVKTAGLAVVAVASAAALAVGKIVKDSLSAGADLEQSLGGIETLFKGSADKVKNYASEAYKTAGLSANDYMESVTSFSASLLQSLGGDTEKAADVANMALIDMSDNANKMGSSMEDIQNAYQGFAKQNYTMLDNLKLGYGGTKEEMQRLLADATKLTGVKYDISNLSDVYNAIHAVQEELDITGTTAKESAETFSGSLASMKAAYSNVLGNLSLGKDIGPALKGLAETTSTFLFGNFIPMVTNVLKGLPEAISTFLQEAAPSFLEGGKQLLSQLGIGIDSGMSEVFQKIQSNLEPVITAFKTAFGQLPGLFQTVVSTMGPIIDSIIAAFAKLDFSGLQSLISAVVPAITNAFTTMMAIVKPAIDMVVNSFVSMWNAAQPLISVLASALMPVLQVVGAFLGGVFKGILMGVSAVLDTITTVIQFLTPVVSWLVEVFKACAPALTTVAEWVGVVVGSFVNLTGSGSTLREVLQGVWNNIKSTISMAGNVISGAISGIRSVFSALGSAGSSLGSIMSSIWGAIRSVISAAGSVIRSVVSAVGSGFSAMGNIFSSVGSRVTGIIDKVKSVIQGLTNIDISGAGAAIMEGFLGGLKSAWEGVKKFVGGIADWIKEHKGPISYDRRLLIPAGNAIMGGFDNSLQNGFKLVQATVSSMASKLMGNFSEIEAPTTMNTDGLEDIKSRSFGKIANTMVRTIPINNQSLSPSSTTQTASLPPIYFESVVQVEGREIARSSAKYMQPELDRLNRKRARLRGDR